METHRSTPKDGWIIGENGQIYAAARPQDIERYIFIIQILITNSSDSFTNLEFRIYEFF